MSVLVFWPSECDLQSDTVVQQSITYLQIFYIKFLYFWFHSTDFHPHCFLYISYGDGVALKRCSSICFGFSPLYDDGIRTNNTYFQWSCWRRWRCCNRKVTLILALYFGHVWGHPHVTPSPIQSRFTSQLSFLCPYTNQHTDPANSILTTTGNHSLTPSFSVYFQTKETTPTWFERTHI